MSEAKQLPTEVSKTTTRHAKVEYMADDPMGVAAVFGYVRRAIGGADLGDIEAVLEFTFENLTERQYRGLRALAQDGWGLNVTEGEKHVITDYSDGTRRIEYVAPDGEHVRPPKFIDRTYHEIPDPFSN